MTAFVADLADDGTTVDHADTARIAEQLEAEDQAAGMRVIGDWPYDGAGNVAE